MFSRDHYKVIKALDFPNTKVLKHGDDQYIDLGYRYRQMIVLFVPVWNFPGEWVGYIGSAEKHIELSEKRLQVILNFYDLKIPENPPIPVWDTIGGKCVILGLILLYVVYVQLNKDDLHNA